MSNENDTRTSDPRAIAEAVASKCNTCGAPREYIGKRRWRCPTYDCPGIVDWLADPPAPRTNDAPAEAARCPGLRERARLTHVAVRDTEGQVWSLPRPYRHHHVLKVMYDHGAKQREDNHENQGFLDAHGHYLTRKQALVNAHAHHQLIGGKTIASILTSEDLW